MTGLLFAIFVLALILAVPIAFAILLASIGVLAVGDIPLVVVPQRMFASIDSFPLVAVPFFIFAGDLLARGMLSKRLVEFADSMVGQIRGGLSIVSVAASMLFASMSGSGAATTAVTGTILIPRLKERGYKVEASAALIAAAGTIGVVFPPSVPMVLYAVITEQSVGGLFRNGFIPGTLMGLTLMGIALAEAYKLNYPKGSKFSIRNLLSTFAKAFFGLLMPVILLGGIFSGFFTPSEAAVVSVVYAAAASKLIYNDLNLKELYRIMVQSARTTSIILIIIACSGAFGWVLANWRIPQQFADMMLSFSQNPYIIMLLIAVIILIFGLFMEPASAIIIMTPVFLPLVISLGIDLIHFGLVIVVGNAIGKILPPVAINLFVASSITGVPIEKISRSVVPYIIGLVIIFMLVLFGPMFFPRLIL